MRDGFSKSFTLRKNGGRGRDRTGDPLLAKQVLSQLSYTPTQCELALMLKHLQPFANIWILNSNSLQVRGVSDGQATELLSISETPYALTRICAGLWCYSRRSA